MKFLLSLILISANITTAFTQDSSLIYSGEIEYEKRVNIHSIIDEMIASYPETQGELSPIREQTTRFATQNFTLYFNEKNSLYKQNKPNEKMPLTFLNNLLIYSNPDSKTCSVEKDIRGEIFFVEDSLRQFKWRITDEEKTILNYECRRANALLFDSIYVVAFFANSIVSQAGPDAFNGLPGLIMQISLPHEHITWEAKRVSIGDPTIDLNPPKHKNGTNRAEFTRKVENFAQGNNAFRQLLLKQLLL